MVTHYMHYDEVVPYFKRNDYALHIMLYGLLIYIINLLIKTDLYMYPPFYKNLGI